MRTRISAAAVPTERQRRSIAATIGTGVSLKELHRSGRFPDITIDALPPIADEAGVRRKRCSKRSCCP